MTARPTTLLEVLTFERGRLLVGDFKGLRDVQGMKAQLLARLEAGGSAVRNSDEAQRLKHLANANLRLLEACRLGLQAAARHVEVQPDRPLRLYSSGGNAAGVNDRSGSNLQLRL